MMRADVAAAAKDSLIVLTSAVEHRRDMSADGTVRFKDDVLLAMRDKSLSELAIMIATLGDTAAELLRVVAVEREMPVEELLQGLALAMRQGFDQAT